MQQIVVWYKDGSRKDIELPFVPIDQAAVVESQIDISHLNTAGVVLRRFAYVFSEQAQKTNLFGQFEGRDFIFPIAKPADYKRIQLITVDGEPILESDDKGGLVAVQEAKKAPESSDMRDDLNRLVDEVFEY